MLRKLPILFSLLLVLTACGLPGSGPDATPTPTLLPGDGGGALDPGDPTPTGAVTPVTGGLDACLEGGWRMSNADLNAMMAILLPMPGMSLQAGEFLLTFDGQDFAYQSDGIYTLRSEIPDGYMEADAVFLITGTASSNEGSVFFDNFLYDGEVLTWRAMIDGNLTEVVGTTTITIPPPGSGPYTCTGTTLTVDSVSGTGTPFTMTFTRMP